MLHRGGSVGEGPVAAGRAREAAPLVARTEAARLGSRTRSVAPLSASLGFWRAGIAARPRKRQTNGRRLRPRPHGISATSC